MTALVCVVGGGPAGSAVAIRLAQLGHRVVLVDRGAPRRRPGESLSPGIWPQLDLLGARQAIETAGFRECRRSVIQWGSPTPTLREFAGMAGLLVDRARFDRVMLDVAAAHGVEVLRPARVRERRFENGLWRLRVDGERPARFDASMLVLAGGRVGSAHRTRSATGPRTLVLYGSWRGKALPDEPRIEAGADQWFWGMPLADGGYGAMVFLDPRRLVELRRAGPLASVFAGLIARSGLMAGATAELASPVLAGDARPYLDRAPGDRSAVKIGEAALALDPLSSSGVQRAMQSALAGAVVVNTLLRRPRDGDAALEFHRNSLAAAARRHRRWAAGFYQAAGRSGRFWRERSAYAEPAPRPSSGGPPPPDLPIALAPGAAVVTTPCIVGDFVARRPAVWHPRLEEPVAFVGGREIAPLLQALRPGMIAADLVRAWSAGLAPRAAIAIVAWMLDAGVLTAPADNAAFSEVA